MSRFREGDYDGEPEQILAMGRWEWNARRALKSKRGRKALAELREALMALPERRLIEGALCTVGDPYRRVPPVTDAELAEADARADAFHAEYGLPADTGDAREQRARLAREFRDEERGALAESIERQGCGVCANGAILWHRLVKDGMDPDEAFASLPTLMSEDDGDPLEATAALAAKDAGLTYTLAWELAYRNDETYDRMTPEERWEAFVRWIDRELAEAS